MGNRTELDHDPAGNVIERRLFGELVDVPGDAQNVLLERESLVHDAMNRPVLRTRAHFDPATQTPIGDGESTTMLVYDGESRVVQEIDDNGHQTTHDFDAVGRRSKTVDPAGNTTELAYDAAGNVIARTQIDLASDGRGSQLRVWTHRYDARNNLIAASDPLGAESLTCYDSLGRETAEIDARGNRITHTYDGAGRLLETQYWLTDNGTGEGMVLGAAVMRQVWDASDRLIAREDPNGNRTIYEYDSLNRVVAEIFADGTVLRSSYDVHDNLQTRLDPNGTALTHTYDALNRLAEVAVAPGPTVDPGTTFETYDHDGRSLLVRARDDDSEVLRSYDSLGALLSEVQAAPQPRTIAYVRDGLGNPISTLYPSGRRIDRSFDGLRRTTAIHDGGETLARLEYLGPDRIRKQLLPVGLRSEYTFDAGRRMVASRHSIDGELLDAREYEFDATGNKRLDRDLTPGGVAGTHQIGHDSLHRSVHSKVTGSHAGDRILLYEFDDAGNRAVVIGYDACAGAYEQLGPDALVHQYTSTPCELWLHDAAGNLVTVTATGQGGVGRWFAYDHRDRLVEVVVAGAAEAHRFAYDALGRKIRAWRVPGEGDDYVYDGWNVIEEYSHQAPVAGASYINGDDLDERIEMRRGGASWWYLDDELGSTVAVVHRDQDEQLTVERYAYRDYGQPAIFVNGELVRESFAGNPFLYTGSRWLAEPRLYDYRTRHFDPIAGRFISRDRLGIWGDEENLGNGYTYVGNTPDTYTDPTGEYKKPHVKNCHRGAQAQIEAAFAYGEPMARRARNWFNQQAKRKRVSRKKDWTESRNDARKWWGTYDNTRFNRIKWNFRKIAHRCSKDVITFKCRTTGYCNRYTAWTHSFWLAAIRLCKNDNSGFFKADGDFGMKLETLGSVIVHEISHNINAIGDKEINGNKMYSETEVQQLAKRKPGVASWNAANYDEYARSR